MLQIVVLCLSNILEKENKVIANYKGPILGEIQPKNGTMVKLEASLVRISSRLPRKLSFRLGVVLPDQTLLCSDKHEAFLEGRGLRNLSGGDISFKLAEWLKKAGRLSFAFVEGSTGYELVGYGSLRIIPWECAFPLVRLNPGKHDGILESAFTFNGEAARRYQHFKSGTAGILVPV